MAIATSALPPAYAFVQTHGDLLTQMGATKVEATDGFEITATFSDNSKAVNADALLKDTVWGAKLVIDNQSMTPDAPTPSAYGMTQLLGGVANLEVYSIEGTPHEIIGVSFDRKVVTGLQAMVDETPIPGVTVSIPDEPA